MTPIRRIAQGFAAFGVARLASNALEVTSVHGLDLIAMPGINVIIWRRTPAADFAPLLEAPPAPSPGDEPFVAALETLDADIARHLTPLKLASPGRGRIVDEIARLAAAFCGVAGTDAARIHLERLERQSSRVFHTDKTALRLLASYGGPGAQWLPEEADDKTAPSSRSSAATGRDHGAIRETPAGYAALFKGDAWPGESGGGAHRSPPIEGTETRRILLRIDAPRFDRQ